jgi:FkbM family methyltransferase
MTMDDLVEKLEAMEARLRDAVEARLRDIETTLDRKLDRMWLTIDFIRTHSAAYLGDNVSLTHLIDETPMLVNSNDYYGPMHLISGGRYEEDNLEILHSFLEDGAVFLDIGANLGFFALRIGQRLRRHGKVYAFEPHPKLAELARHSAEHNGLTNVTVFNYGLSNAEAYTEFQFKKGHLGAGTIGHNDDIEKYDNLAVQVKRLDDEFGEDFKVDLVKIDVEGQELAVLEGMRETIKRSPTIKILFEKISMDPSYEAGIKALFDELGFTLFAVTGVSVLAPLAANGVVGFHGSLFAARPGQIDALDRRRFSIYPSQLWFQGRPPPGLGERLLIEAPPGALMFHGPYWFLIQGTWELRIHGNLTGEMEITLAERFGHTTQVGRLSDGQLVWRFVNRRDLIRFELIACAAGDGARVEIDRLELALVMP